MSDHDPIADPSSAVRVRREVLGLMVLFGVLYFVQGIAEPTEGLIAQPVRSMLHKWQHSAREVGLFGALLSIPWTIKPLFGLISDFVPLFGWRRKSYLVLMNLLAASGLCALYVWPPQAGSIYWLFGMLLLPTFAVAFADVVIDALMVEKGQPLQATGRLQSVQWGAMYGATILTGMIGAQLSHLDRQDLGFLICGVVSLVALVASLFFVREGLIRPTPPEDEIANKRSEWRESVALLWNRETTPTLIAVGAFLFLWNFNPFSSAVLQKFMEDELKFDERFIGWTISLQAIASLVACVAYGLLCRRIPVSWLTHLSIGLGILSTVGYWLMFDETSAALVSLAVGFTYMTANLIQLDLAARVCPPRIAGTVFAFLMSLSNAGLVASLGCGGMLYDEGIRRFGNPTLSFQVLVGIGAFSTALCWLLQPWLRGREWQTR